MLETFRKRYQEIMAADLSAYRKDMQLAGLMSEMEWYFRIPLLKNPA